MSRRARIVWRITALLTALLAGLAVTAVLILKSDWFLEKVRQRIVAEIERSTGGVATFEKFSFHWPSLRAEVTNFTLRGTEPAGAPPLFEAKSIQVGLKIVSLWKQDIDIRSIVIKEPKIALIVNADGSTNVPAPKIPRPQGKPGREPLLDWKIGQFSIENGTMQIADEKSHLNAKGEKLHARLSYDFAGPRYKGEISIWPLELNVGKIRPLNMKVDVFVSMEKNRIEISNAKFDLRRSHVEAAGAIEDLSAPKGTFRFTARVAAAEAGEVLRIPAARQGTIDLAGSFNYNSPSDYTIAAGATIRGLEVLESGIHISGIRGTCQARLNPSGLELDRMALDTLG